TDADGFVIQSSRVRLKSPIYIGDRAHFKIQRDATTAALYISEPLVGRNSGKLTLEFTRRLTKPDGSFDGEVSSALDITQLQNFFSSLDIGRGGVVSIVGTDTILRARGGPSLESADLARISLSGSPLFDHLQPTS